MLIKLTNTINRSKAVPILLLAMYREDNAKLLNPYFNINKSLLFNKMEFYVVNTS